MGDKTGAVAAAKSYVQELLDAYYNYEDALNRADLGKTQKAGANAKLDSMWKAYLEAERAYKALAKKSRATDLEPIPVEDASSECARCNGSGRNGANPCEKCNGSGWADPKKQGKPFTDAKDSARRVRLHRALDAVMDSVKGKDEDDSPYERKMAAAKPGAHVILEAGYGAKGGDTGQDFIRLSADAGAAIIEKRGSDIWVDLNTPHRLGKRWKFPVMAIKA